ncbi:hypothetical protein B0181_06865 [Moraxella caviae]|uniref:Thiosulfate sulfurtransferase PspE n=1 Tax=Moraxella caviae TaxID=34060 RepID=A0A1T0A142_9GAMM|nr:rhodanese-like domain-containing protein [Moraxella caviae]OOR89397.1 hypothetical protein B0181_06865 [Moraxella caviae]STZ09882.1 Thiosulfate sulfurtransferase PspE precursor [Moraxella caviae]VEW12932.1 Thiosulfate sulfurtransferase PspE precursor [Moraxella caviae]
MKIIVLTALAAALSLTACSHSKPVQTATQSTQTQAPTEATKKQKDAGVWIDVRGSEEFAAGHLKGALNITTAELAQRIASVEPDKNARINVYCRSGRRAGEAKALLESLGYTNVVNHGGYADLVAQGYE